MPRQYNYQYETSPRKLKQVYENNPKKKNIKPKSKTVSKNNTKPIKKKIENNRQNIKKQDENIVKPKIKKESLVIVKFSLFLKGTVIFAILFAMIFMNSKISESFSQIQKLKASITEIQKENDQLEIKIQNSVTLSSIEQAAKELLGMQKISNNQTFYISLSKKDYIEPKIEEVILEDEAPSFLDTIKEIISQIF